MSAVVLGKSIFSPLDLPYFDPSAVEHQFKLGAGSSITAIQSRVIASLQDQFSLSAGNAIDHSILTTLQCSISGNQPGLPNLKSFRSIATPKYGLIAEDVLRSERLRICLHSLSSVLPQHRLFSLTVIGGFIPACLLERPVVESAAWAGLVRDFHRQLHAPLRDSGHSDIFARGWLELELIDDPPESDNKGACLRDWWLIRGSDIFNVGQPPRVYSLHAHIFGAARTPLGWATPSEIGDVFREDFPCRYSVMAKGLDLQNAPEINMDRIARYLLKIAGNRSPHRPMPGGLELAANARFWNEAPSGLRDIDLSCHSPEIGPRAKNDILDPDFNKLEWLKLSCTWRDANHAWTPDLVDEYGNDEEE